MGASGGDDSQCSNCNRNRKIDESSINHKALETLPMALAATPATDGRTPS